ncbi:MAG: ATP-binding protein [Sedimenticola sp.]
MREIKNARRKLIMAERIHLYYAGLGVSGVGTIVLAWVVGSLAGGPENNLVVIWGAAMLFSGLAQIGLWLAWIRRQPTVSRSWKWQYFPLPLMILTGLCWGLAGAYPFPDYSSDASLLLAIATSGGVLLNLILLSALELAISLFLLATLVPFATSFLNAQQLPPSTTTVMLLSGVIALGLIAVALSVLSGIIARLRAGKRNVSGKLDLVKEEVEGLHSKLSQQHEKRKDVEQELYRAKGEAETANMVKSEFLATISHEIRTPLNGILPLLEILRETKLDHEQKQFVNTALNSSHHLMTIINDILDFSKIEAGKLEVEHLDVDLHEMVESVISLMSKSAERKDLELSCSFGEQVPRRAQGDPIRIRQVLTNMVSNAIKFTEHGSVSVKVKLHDPDGEEQELLFAVKDTGVGINEDVQRRLFQSFSQADASTTRIHGGTGLGLAISKRLVELMGGKIGVTSQEGKGSVFWFTLPYVEAHEEIATTHWNLRGMHILVVAKKGVQSGKLEKLLEDWGTSYDRISELSEAVPLLLNAGADRREFRYNMVIIDTHAYDEAVPRFLSEMQAQPNLSQLKIILLDGDGFELTEDFDKRFVTRLPLAFTKKDLFLQLCSVTEEEGAACDLAFEEVTQRPLEQQDDQPLEMEQDYYLEAGDDLLSVSPDEPHGLDEYPLTGRVLVVEDNPVNLGVARKLLQRLGLESGMAEDGESALEEMERTQYDLVLMDCQMPRMDGYEATREVRLRENEYGLARIPIVAMTANAMVGDKNKCLEVGMDDYISKPLSIPSLRSILRHWLPMAEMLENDDSLRISDLEIPREASGPVLGGVEGVAQITQLLESLEVIDQEVVAELYEIMAEDFTSLLEVFLDNSPESLDLIEKSIREGDCSRAILPAHSLKSSSANVGAMRLSGLAKKMEAAARKNDLATLEGGIMELREAYDQAERELQGLCESTQSLLQ